MNSKIKKVELRIYNLKELEALYQVDARTMKQWLKKHQAAIGPRTGNYFMIPQVEHIFRILGLPGNADDDY